MTVKLLHASGQLVYGDQSATVLQPSNFQIGVRQIVAPELWNTDQLVHSEFNIDVHSFKIRITRYFLFYGNIKNIRYFVSDEDWMKNLICLRNFVIINLGGNITLKNDV